MDQFRELYKKKKSLGLGGEVTSFFWLIKDKDSRWIILELNELHLISEYHEKVLVFMDSSSLPKIPGWPLRNALFWLGKRHGVSRLKVLCYRETRLSCDIHSSLLIDVELPQVFGELAVC